MSTQSHSISLAVPPEPTDHLEGSEHARVTLVEYGDFECPSCKVAAATPKLLLERFPNKIRFLFRHFPLQDAHPHALLAAEASEAAAAGLPGTSSKTCTALALCSPKCRTTRVAMGTVAPETPI